MSRRRAVWLVARREIVERVRERAFVVSTAVLVLLVVCAALAPVLLDGAVATAQRVGVVGDGAARLGRAAAERSARDGAGIDLRPFTDHATAAAALRTGRLDAALVPGGRLLVRSEADPALVGLLEESERDLRLRAALGPGAAAALERRALRVEPLEPPGASPAYALFGVLMLQGALIAYGSWVAAGVIEEKATRMVELLLATIRPSQLLAGKLVGVGLVGIAQLTLLYAVRLGALMLSGRQALPAGTLAALPLLLGWFALGYALYSSAFAVAGALVSRPEQLQTTLTPITVAVVASSFVALATLADPGAPLVRVASLFPPLAPMVMPIRTASGSAGAWEQGLAVALTLASTASLVPLAARIYAGAVLRTGRRLSLREAWRGAEVRR